MGFIGSVQAPVRAILADLAPRWRKRPVYVGCSGNFTVERILLANGVEEVHGCDVSIYSCAVGALLTDAPFRLELKDEAKDGWMAEYMDGPVEKVAQILLCTNALQFDPTRGRYHQRMWDAHRRGWADLHARTVEKVAKATEGVRLTSYAAEDVMTWIDRVPEDAVFVSFPPTYEGGYETLYKRLEATFDWDAPEYELFDEESFAKFWRKARTKQTWMTLRDHEVPELAEHQLALTQTGMRSKPVFVYGGEGQKRVAMPHQTIAPVPWPRCTEIAEPPLKIGKLSAGQFNTLRSEHMDPKIVPGSIDIGLGVFAGGKILGAFSIGRARIPGVPWQAYLLSDFAIEGKHKRLSALVLAAALSVETKAVLEQSLGFECRVVGTTAFTERATSMKYRGLFKVYNRKAAKGDEPALVNYTAPLGRWTLEEAWAWWSQKHASVLRS